MHFFTILLGLLKLYSSIVLYTGHRASVLETTASDFSSRSALTVRDQAHHGIGGAKFWQRAWGDTRVRRTRPQPRVFANAGQRRGAAGHRVRGRRSRVDRFGHVGRGVRQILSVAQRRRRGDGRPSAHHKTVVEFVQVWVFTNFVNLTGFWPITIIIIIQLMINSYDIV